MKQLHAKRGTRSWLPQIFLFMLLFAALESHAQNRQVTGIVSDVEGPMAGVAVTIPGSTVGVTTDAKGRYSITVAADKTLHFSFMGYADVTEQVGPRTVIDVVMQEAATALDDIVVIGYGTVRRRDLTGSVTSVKQDVILATPSGNVMQALQGRIAGLDFSKDGSKDQIRMRGNRSINGQNDPLFIIDGIQVDAGAYKNLNPADIASIDILKDASSTAIYGSQGANGVIIITTKSPEKGKLSVSYNAYAGWTMQADENTRRHGESWLAPRLTAAKNAGMWLSEADNLNLFDGNEAAMQAYERGEWTDYRKLLSRNPFTHNHTLSFSGGTENTNARFSAGWEQEQTQREGGSANSFNLNTVVNHKLNNWLSAGVNVRLAHNYDKVSPYQSNGDWKLGSPYNADGTLNQEPIGKTGDLAYVNPLIDRYYSNMKVEKNHSTIVSATGYIDVKPLEGLTFRTQFNTTLSTSVEGEYTDKNASDQINGTQQSKSAVELIPRRNMEWNNILSYEKTIGDHTFGGTFLTAWTKSIKEQYNGSGTNALVNSNLWYALGGTENQMITSDYIQSQMFSYAARVNYSYQGKYLLTASWRRDGASRLSKGHKWDSFPSAALAWRISEENFMAGASNWLDHMKLRLSYGVTGNSTIDPYGTLSGVTPYTGKLALQDKPLLHYDYNGIIGNLNTKWEKSTSVDIGLDFSFFKGRLEGAIDYYDTNTTDLLLARKLPSSAGADGNFTIMQNIGKTNNRGIEVSLTGYPVRNDKFTWRATLTFSKNKEQIKELYGGLDYISLDTEVEKNTLMVGRPIKSYRTYEYQGIWTSDEAAEAATWYKDANRKESFQPGDYKVRGRNDDDIISIADDYDYVGSQTPDWFAGFDHSFRYKNFDLNIYFFFRWGQWGENPGSKVSPSDGGAYTLYDKWIYAEGTNEKGAKLPPLYLGRKAHDYYGYQSVWYCDQSFFKIKNISLGYTLPQSALSKIRLQNCRVYVSAANPFYRSKSSWMKGIDPEKALRNYILGLEISF